MVVDALGAPLQFVVTEGQRHDSCPAIELLKLARTKCLIADKAYDSDVIRAALAAQRAQAVIPSTSNRCSKIAHDKERYKARVEVECAFNLLKQARRFATRYEKTLRNYESIVALGCAMLWLRF